MSRLLQTSLLSLSRVISLTALLSPTRKYSLKREKYHCIQQTSCLTCLDSMKEVDMLSTQH